MPNAVLLAHGVEPAGTTTARGDNRLSGNNARLAVTVAHHKTAAHAVLNHDLLALGLEEDVHTGVKQVLLDTRIELLGLLGAKMADGAVHELEARANGATANLRNLVGVAKALDVRVGAKVEVHLVNAVDGVLRELVADELGQVAAHLARERELAAREARGDAARLAVDAVSHLGLGAAALLDRQSLLDDGDGTRVSLADKTERGEDAGRTSANNRDVRVDGSGCVCHVPLVPLRKGPVPWARPLRTHFAPFGD